MQLKFTVFQFFSSGGIQTNWSVIEDSIRYNETFQHKINLPSDISFMSINYKGDIKNVSIYKLVNAFLIEKTLDCEIYKDSIIF